MHSFHSKVLNEISLTSVFWWEGRRKSRKTQKRKRNKRKGENGEEKGKSKRDKWSFNNWSTEGKVLKGVLVCIDGRLN